MSVNKEQSLSELHADRMNRVTNQCAAGWLRNSTQLRIVLFGLLVTTCLGWTVFAGRDINFDLLNYHYYVAHAFWTDRLDKDLLPASIQSYLNPIAYLPFYWMEQAGWHSLAIGLVLAALHSVNLILLMLIAEAALFRDVEHRHLWGFAAAIAGGLSPVFLGELGSTFNDVISSIGVLLGIYLVFRRVTFSKYSLMMAGLAMGIAAGLKLTNAIFVVAAVPSLLFVFENWNAQLRAILWFAAGTILGFALSEGYWGFRVYQEFGNPFFPFMNKLFASPDFPSVNIVSDRFLPRNILDAVTLPLRMASLEPWEYTEPVAPDLRFLALILVASIGLAWALFRSKANWTGQAAIQLSRIQSGLFVYFGTSLTLWLASSGNGRYGLSLLLLIGPLLVSTVYRIFNIPVAMLVTSIILILQIFHMTIGGNPRWGAVAWKTDWFNNFSPPSSLTQRPYLYLSMGLQSLSFIVPKLHPDSAFVNIVGQWPIPSEGHGSAKLRSMLKKYNTQTRILTALPKSEYVGGKPTKEAIFVINDSLDRLNLKINQASCQVFQMQLFEETGLGEVGSHKRDIVAKAHDPEPMLSCVVVAKQVRDSKLVRTERHLTPLYHAFETTCPELFSPPGAALEKVDKYWKRFYSNSDITLWSDGVWLFYSRIRGTTNVVIGKVSDFENGVRHISCTEMPRPAVRF